MTDNHLPDVRGEAHPLHTPGPWRYGKGPTNEAKHAHVYHDIEGGRMIATTGCPYTENPVIAVANARLMAAAPDLLEALKAMVDRWEPEPDCDADRRMWEAACAAIAKATSDAVISGGTE